MVELKEIAQIVTGKTPPTKETKYWGGSIPFITPADLQGGMISIAERAVTEEGLKISKALPKGTVLVSCIGYIGKIGIIDSLVAVTNQQINAVVPNAELTDNWYLAYMFMHQAPRLQDLANITTVPILNKSNFEAFNVPLPPLSEQQAIAHALRAVQQAREARQRQLALERERKAALMEHLFTHGTRDKPRRQTEIGEIPESWRVVKLGELSNISAGGTPSRKRSEFYNGDIPWVKTLDLTEGVVNDTEEKITEAGLHEIRGKVRPLNTVMVAMYGGAGTVGKSGILAVQAATNQAVCCIEPNLQKFEPFYLLYYLIRLRPTWMRHAIGTRKDPNISKGIIQRMPIPLPPLDQQHEIASILRTCDDKIAALEREVALLEELFRALLEELMTGRIRMKG